MFLKISISSMLMLFSIIGYSQLSIQFYGTGYQSYCSTEVPGGTFVLVLGGASCTEHAWTWSNIQGNGCQSDISPITDTTSYPTQTTTYSCRNELGTIYYFTITVYDTPLYSVSGYNCCSSGGTVTLSGSQSGVTYELYKNGSYVGSSYDKPGTGSALNWTVTSAGTYTVKAVFHYTCTKSMSGSAVFNSSCCKIINDINNNDASDNGMKVYPNPSRGDFIFETSIIGEYILVNNMGQEIRRFKVTTNNTSVELMNLKPGIYFIRNTDLNDSHVSKITIIE